MAKNESESGSDEKKPIIEHVHSLDTTTKVILGVAVVAITVGVLGAALVPLKLKLLLPKIGLKSIAGI